MAETPSDNEAFFKEVDDAVRQDRMSAFGQRYGLLVIGAIVAGLVALGGWLYWGHSSRENSGEMAEKAQDVLESAAAGHAPDSAKLAELAKADQPGYRAMALLTQAAAAAQKGDVKGGAKLYGDIAADTKLDQSYRDLATIRQVALSFEDMKPQQIVDRLKPLAVEGGPWFGSAGEMTAIAYMKMGKKDLAGPVFAAIAKDPKAPETLRSRARQMAGLMGIDAVDLEVKPAGDAAASGNAGSNAGNSEGAADASE
ncbi:MAG: tetratricopeptide repeat protein [Sphingobium sp.]|nr:tetratricopeptide repeat protein [Sphingobium sp.]